MGKSENCHGGSTRSYICQYARAIDYDEEDLLGRLGISEEETECLPATTRLGRSGKLPQNFSSRASSSRSRSAWIMRSEDLRPISTYRLQLSRGTTFDDASELVEISSPRYRHLLRLPILKARAGSTHGYDVIDHSVLNPEIGSLETMENFVARLKRLGMGLVVDIVPNHMCVSDLSNWRWCDVLENGPSSPQSQFFDIDWTPPREDLENKVLLPRLGDQYGQRARKPGDPDRVHIRLVCCTVLRCRASIGAANMAPYPGGYIGSCAAGPWHLPSPRSRTRKHHNGSRISSSAHRSRPAPDSGAPAKRRS